MELIPWGQLPKSQIDPEKIEEAIARMIVEHNNDPNAHTEEGQSLYAHKTAEVIQHAVESIVADKIKNFEIEPNKLNWDMPYIDSHFESLENIVWDKRGDAHCDLWCGLGGLRISATRTQDGGFELYNQLIGFQTRWEKNPVFQTRLEVVASSGTTQYWGIGTRYFDEILYTRAGFQVKNGKLYAMTAWVDDNEIEHEYREEITGIDYSKSQTYRVEVYKDKNEIKYYINNILKKTITNYLPWNEGMYGPIGCFGFVIDPIGAGSPKFYIERFAVVQNP